MSIAAQNLSTNSSHHICFFCSTNVIHGVNTLKHLYALTLPIYSRRDGRSNSLHFEVLGQRDSWQRKQLQPFEAGRQWRSRAFEPEGTLQGERLDGKLNLDAFLSIAEVLCLVPSTILTVGYAVNWIYLSSSQKAIQVPLVNGVFVWQYVLLVIAVAVGTLIRRRQWRRICRESFKSGGRSSLNLVERIEKLEEDLRNSATIVRVLSRQLEKLGIRFRITRKALKEPTTQTTALVQKNSEVTRALAAREDNLEKELGEIQKVLLAMQEQQQKQLELILAICKVGKLRESKRNTVIEGETIEPSNSNCEENLQQMETETQNQGGISYKGTKTNRI
ncbi:PREDICTED: uncharacterized protein LOC104599595 [Nelumbo nucifera]|uniref:Uncharacterized protein LOC104599595 n=2 Tax=Nelumbo nucifera TaxID=4432 RepID=A0A1U8A0T8_NELNU|nr:PREDICTED: uncharacterized protein LOC104599595 [Nelumbo nucifera]DAD22642.1 TPA_asm: hypothetical protein HUJ06_024105 [Nelumbo nucifera]